MAQLTKENTPITMQACKEMCMLALIGLRYRPRLFSSTNTPYTNFELSLHFKGKLFQSSM